MVLGSYYLQTGRIDTTPLFVSMIPAVLLFQIAITNEIPDFIQDRLVGKKNLCVRLGRERTARLYGAVSILFFIICVAGLLLGQLPLAMLVLFLLAPLFYTNYKSAIRFCNDPQNFLIVVRQTIVLYVVIMAVIIAGYIKG